MRHFQVANSDWAPVRDASAQVEAGLIPADSLARLALSRIAIADADIGAFVCTADPDAILNPSLPAAGPLAGLPVAVKDIFDTSDLPTAYGSPIYAGQPLRHDAAIVSVLRRAGAIVIGKATTTEFAFLEPTATRNPRAPGRTPGGSSAGSAAAVAAGLVPLAIGTQTGGSVIRPASYCGVVGYKPSFGWLPTAGLKCFSWSLDTVGLFARNVPDIAWFAQAVSGRALGLDPTPGALSGRGWTVGVPASYPWSELTPAARLAMERGCRALEAAGVTLRRCELPHWTADAYAAHATIQGYEAWRSLMREFEHHGGRLSAMLADYLRGAREVTALEYEVAQQLLAMARADMASWFKGIDLLLTPSAPDVAPCGYASTGSSSFNRLWTLLGLPCISVPGLQGEGGAPIGLQLIAPSAGDAFLLRAAAELELALHASAPSD